MPWFVIFPTGLVLNCRIHDIKLKEKLIMKVFSIMRSYHNLFYLGACRVKSNGNSSKKKETLVNAVKHHKQQVD